VRSRGEGVAARVGDEREGIRVGDGPGLNYFRVQVFADCSMNKQSAKPSKYFNIILCQLP